MFHHSNQFWVKPSDRLYFFISICFSSIHIFFSLSIFLRATNLHRETCIYCIEKLFFLSFITHLSQHFHLCYTHFCMCYILIGQHASLLVIAALSCKIFPSFLLVCTDHKVLQKQVPALTIQLLFYV